MGPGFDATSLRRAIDDSLASFLASRRTAIARLAAPSARLVDLVAEVVAGGGKRLRPSLCWAGYRFCGGPDGPEIVQAAASLELLHTFAIIHDDVMDQAVLRRGQPALHRRVAGERAGTPDAAVFGVSVAVLAGDLALSLSDAMLAGSGFPPPVLARAAGPVRDMREQAIAGQYLDLLHAGSGAAVSAEDAALTGMLKTAGYSVSGPLLVGAALAGALPGGAAAAALAAYAAALGEAFTLGDEVLGLFGDAAGTGKDAESDLHRGKPTRLIAEALALAGPAGRATLAQSWGNPAGTAADLAAVRAAVAASGALAWARERIGGLLASASGALASPGGSGASGAGVEALRAIVADVGALYG